jgi:hypothetical protein
MAARTLWKHGTPPHVSSMFFHAIQTRRWSNGSPRPTPRLAMFEVWQRRSTAWFGTPWFRISHQHLRVSRVSVHGLVKTCAWASIATVSTYTGACHQWTFLGVAAEAI